MKIQSIQPNQPNQYIKQTKSDVSFGMNLRFKDSGVIAKDLIEHFQFRKNNGAYKIEKEMRPPSFFISKFFDRYKTEKGFNVGDFLSKLKNIFENGTKEEVGEVIMDSYPSAKKAGLPPKFTLTYKDKANEKTFWALIDLDNLFKAGKSGEPNHEHIIQEMHDSYVRYETNCKPYKEQQLPNMPDSNPFTILMAKIWE